MLLTVTLCLLSRIPSAHSFQVSSLAKAAMIIWTLVLGLSRKADSSYPKIWSALTTRTQMAKAGGASAPRYLFCEESTRVAINKI